MGSPPLSEEERDERPTIAIKGKEIAVSVIKCGYFYSLQIVSVSPTAQTRWIAEGVEMQSWKAVYERAFKITSSSKLQSLQYRIIHRYFPTRRFLFTRHVVNDPFCDNCGQVDTLEHYFYDCSEVKEFWAQLASIVNARGFLIRISSKDVLLGSDGFPDVVNFIMLVAKQFIVNQNYRDENKAMAAFRASLLSIFNMEKYIAKKNLSSLPLTLLDV